jgi:adenylate cyclase
MPGKTVNRKLTAVLYADIADYSRLTQNDEVGTHQEAMAVLDEASIAITNGGGKVLRYAGDAILAEFESAVNATNTAVDIQQTLVVRNADKADADKVQIRIGLNIGDVIQDRGEIYGDGVNLAARLEAASEPGGLCISAAIYDQVKGKIQAEFRDGGRQTFKNITDPVSVYHWHPKATKSSAVSVSGDVSEIRPSIAVLPFDNMSGDPEQEYFADGITEDITTALSKIRSFLVISRNSSFTYKGQGVDTKTVAEELGVRYVLEGSVRKAGSRIRITAQLIDALTGHHIWAERYDRKLNDIFDLQDEITQTIVATIEPELSAKEREAAARKPPENLDAWEIFQRAMWYFYGFEKDQHPVAIELFDKSIRVDPAFAPSYAFKSYCHYAAVVMGWTDDPEYHRTLSMECAKKALVLDPKDAVGYFAICRIYMLRGEHDASIAAGKKAIELNPNTFYAYHGLAFALVLAGEEEEGIKMSIEAERVSPRDPLLWSAFVVRALAYNLLARYEEAITYANKAVQIPSSSSYWPHALKACALAQTGRVDEARAALGRATDEKPDLTIDYIACTLPTKLEGGLQPYLEGLRKAGLPEE